jgi:hypothetical protein
VMMMRMAAAVNSTPPMMIASVFIERMFNRGRCLSG